MSALTSLLARDQVVPVKKIEEAIQRQVISGGDLSTVLLETGGIPENVLSAYVAATYGMISATRAEAMAATEEVAKALPKPLVDRARCVPIMRTGEGFVIAATSPLALDVEQEIADALGAPVETRIVLEPRLAALLAQFFEGALPSRMRRLVDRLRETDPGVTPVVSAIGINRIERPASTTAPKAQDAAYARPKAAATTLAGSGGTSKYGALPDVGKVSGAPASVPDVKPEDAPANVVRVAPVSTPAQAEPRSSDARVTNVVASPMAEPKPAEAPKRLVSSLLDGVTNLDEVTASQLIAVAATRDDVLAVTFAFARRSFAYCAVFLVHDDEAEGLDAEGADGASHEVVRTLSFPLSRPSVLREVRDLLGARVSALDVTDADIELRDGLGRTRHQPSTIVPIVIRQRVVVMIYGDRGGRDFGLADLPELLSFVPKVSEALSRIILQKKRGGVAGGTSSPAPIGGVLGSGPKSWAAPNAGVPPEPVSEPVPEVDRVFADTQDMAPETPEIPEVVDAPVAPETRSSVRVTTSVSIPGLGSPRTDARSGSERPAGFDLLGVPRKAPPPPSVDERASRPQADDDEPELEIESISQGGASSQLDRAHTGYHMSGAVEEVVVLRKPAQRASRPPAKSELPPAQPDAPRERRPDPRREDDAEGIPPEVLRAQRKPAVVEEASIITDEGTSVDAIVERLCASTPETADAAIAELLLVGEVAATVVARRFPGPLWIERKDIGAKIPRGRDVSPLARALLAFKDKAANRVVGLLEHRDGNVRFYASIVAGELVHRDLVLPLGRRLFEVDVGTQKASLESLRAMRRFTREFADVLDAVRAVAGNDRADVDRRVIALRVLGELRDDRAVSLLVEMLAEGDAGLVAQAHAALVVITRQDFGRTSAAWKPWIDANAPKHRVEWLMDSLLHNDEEIRRAAGEELKVLTQEYFGFHPSLPKRERELAHRKYRQWWEQHGASRFSLLPG